MLGEVLVLVTDPVNILSLTGTSGRKFVRKMALFSSFPQLSYASLLKTGVHLGDDQREGNETGFKGHGHLYLDVEPGNHGKQGQNEQRAI